VTFIALSAGCQASLTEVDLAALTSECPSADPDHGLTPLSSSARDSEGEEDIDSGDNLIDLNSSPAQCTMVPPFEGEYPEVDAFFASRRQVPADVLRDLKHFGTPAKVQLRAHCGL
jgi:hypothetical protein